MLYIVQFLQKLAAAWMHANSDTTVVDVRESASICGLKECSKYRTEMDAAMHC